jgi:hypothetical protein
MIMLSTRLTLNLTFEREYECACRMGHETQLRLSPIYKGLALARRGRLHVVGAAKGHERRAAAGSGADHGEAA